MSHQPPRSNPPATPSNPVPPSQRLFVPAPVNQNRRNRIIFIMVTGPGFESDVLPGIFDWF